MADFSMSFTVPDGKLSEFVAAVREKYTSGRRGPGGAEVDPSSYTPAQLKEMVRKDFEAQLKRTYAEWKKRQAAIDADIEITA